MTLREDFWKTLFVDLEQDVISLEGLGLIGMIAIKGQMSLSKRVVARTLKIGNCQALSLVRSLVKTGWLVDKGKGVYGLVSGWQAGTPAYRTNTEQHGTQNCTPVGRNDSPKRSQTGPPQTGSGSGCAETAVPDRTTLSPEKAQSDTKSGDFEVTEVQYSPKRSPSGPPSLQGSSESGTQVVPDRTTPSSEEDPPPFFSGRRVRTGAAIRRKLRQQRAAGILPSQEAEMQREVDEGKRPAPIKPVEFAEGWETAKKGGGH